MKVIIDIPEEIYQKIKETSMVISGRRNGERIDYILFNAVNTGTPLEEELEKVKDEIEDTGAYEQEVSGKTEFLKGITYCLNIIDNHISELKGKNKEFNHEEFYNFLLNTIQPNEMEKYRSMFLSSGEVVN